MDQPQIDLKNTESLEHANGKVWAQGFLLRKVSKFITGTAEDGIMPIPVFYDPETGKILEDSLPKELREGHEAHFAQVTRRFIQFYKNLKIPDWEITNLLTKYYLTTSALELAQNATK